VNEVSDSSQRSVKRNFLSKGGEELKGKWWLTAAAWKTYAHAKGSNMVKCSRNGRGQSA